MPMRNRFANGSKVLVVSFQTRSMIEPTVRQAIRINSVAALLEHLVASHATCWSKILVCPPLVAGPGNGGNGHPVLGAAHARGFRHEVGFRGAMIQSAPPSGTIAAVVSGRSARTDPAPVPHGLVRPHPGQQHPGFLTGLHMADGRFFDTQQGCPYA